jgi:dienelactone hydrolase
MLHKFTVLLGASLLVSGCAIGIPDHCKTNAAARIDSRPRERQLLTQFDCIPLGAPGREFTVFVPKIAGPRPGRPPILLLHEMPALSPDVLDLALRLSRKNYSVYVPLLWGNRDDNAASNFVFLRRAIELRASPRWRAGEADIDRPILDDLTALCRSIAALHPEQRLGVIGNCLTGIFPFALAARVPRIAAPVASQPTLPITLSKSDFVKSGLSLGDTRRLQERIRTEPNFQLLAFRFEGDRVSPSARFHTLEMDFYPRFVDGTIPLKLYHCRDRMPPHPHAVLTECHTDNPRFATTHAWEQCLSFLDAKLRHDQPHRFSFRPY